MLICAPSDKNVDALDRYSQDGRRDRPKSPCLTRYHDIRAVS